MTELFLFLTIHLFFFKAKKPSRQLLLTSLCSGCPVINLSWFSVFNI